MTRVGIIGAGLMGAMHARLLAPEVPGRGARRRRRPGSRRGERLAHETQVHVVYADGLELIAAADVDAVVIASPVATHEPFTLACIAGRQAGAVREAADATAGGGAADRRGRAAVGRRSSPSASCAATTRATST